MRVRKWLSKGLVFNDDEIARAIKTDTPEPVPLQEPRG